MRQKNQARSQLAGSPLLVAQLGALELRKWVMTGDSQILPRIRLGTQMSVAEFLNLLGQAPPVAVLQLCYGTKGCNLPDLLLQHADDLDFVQDVLSASGNALELNPMLNGVVAGFNRRRRYSQFKQGHHTLELDRLRFEHTKRAWDSDLHATEMKTAHGSLKTKKRTQKEENSWNTTCSFFQRLNGCRAKDCRYAHKCAICYKLAEFFFRFFEVGEKT